MDLATTIFINGILGVFTGMTVLYIMMKILALTAGRKAPPKEEK